MNRTHPGRPPATGGDGGPYCRDRDRAHAGGPAHSASGVPRCVDRAAQSHAVAGPASARSLRWPSATARKLRRAVHRPGPLQDDQRHPRPRRRRPRCCRTWRSACSGLLREATPSAGWAATSSWSCCRNWRRRRARRTSAQSMLQRCRGPYPIDGHELQRHRQHRHQPLSATTATTCETLIKNADTAMYHAKEHGPQQLPVLHPGR